MAKALILIVEDDGIVARDIQNRLKSLGFEVTASVSSGEEAIIKAKEDLPDLVLMDIVLKGEMDGIEAAEIIRSRFDIPVIFLTAYADEERLERAKLTIPLGYILKPFQDRDLKIAIEMALYAAKVDAKRKQAEEALRKSEDKLDAICSSVHTGIIVIDAESHTIVDANPYAVSLIGVSADTIAGKVCHEYICPAEEGKCPITDLGQTVVSSESILLSIDGERIPILKRVTSLDMDDKKYFLESFIDISDLKKAEEEKKRLEAQLQQAQRMESIGTLAGGIAHNFNNILMGIIGNVSLVLDEIDTNHPNYITLKNIEEQVKSGSKLTHQLLGYARKGRYVVKPLNLNHLVKDTSDTFGITKKEIRVHQDLVEDLLAIKVDQGQIEQVLLNLYVNAADAMAGGGDLYLKTMNVTDKDMTDKLYEPKPGNYVLLTIRDTGVGMDKETMARIFEPFFSTKGFAEGTGLGLASAYGTIKGHGGYIDVSSEKDNGTTFSIYLPATEEKVKGKKEQSGELKKGHGRILFVDDEDMVLNVGEKMLIKMGYDVLSSNNGQKALDLYKENQGKIDLVLLDMVMPDMGGGETYDKLKKNNPKVKVLLASGYSIEGQATEIMNRGCNGFIQKPFNMVDLSQKIRAVLDKE